MRDESPHPGTFIRSEILPIELSVTEAAKLLGVGRPALSNMLNGNSALSPKMAARIESVFGGATAEELLDLQARYDAAQAQREGKFTPKTYVAPFLKIKANDIIEWVNDNLSARARLPVLLRTLVNSTGANLEIVDFPGNDDSQRKGTDGIVKAQSGNQWIPKGESIWEFGVDKIPKKKADHDFEARLESVPKLERAEKTFVFVTPRRWNGKSDWANTQRAKKEWSDVRAYDASDIEQWLEQSISAQAWFAHEIGISSNGVRPLESYWYSWIADCDPAPVPKLFDQYTQPAWRKISDAFDKGEAKVFTITADSTTEALAFLSCALSNQDHAAEDLRDSCVVFSEKNQLSKLAVRKPGFIAIIADRAVEKELGELATPIKAIVIRPRSSANFKGDFRLGTISEDIFKKALKEMGCNSDEIRKYETESGRSATVLRRRLSKLDAIKLPPWVESPTITDLVVPILFAGAWDSENKGDQAVLQFLADGNEPVPYTNIEKEFGKLYAIDESPVWASGGIRGIVSKIDLLFAINGRLVAADLDRFFDVAKNLVLSEKDPSLDLPEEDRWMAGVYGKVRDVSTPLRNGITETLVILAIHGNDLFRERLGFDVNQRIEEMVKSLLVPMTVRSLEEHSQIFPMMAEAAPEVVLELLENDLASEDSAAFGLLRPASSGIFGHCPRTGLLWALESLAWNPSYLPRVVLILGKLSMHTINDNWANKPISSLKSIFRAWMPQTEATLNQRISALDLLISKVPDVGWRICVEQFDGRSTIGDYSYKPRWRNDGNGYGEPISEEECDKFKRYSLDEALQWKCQSVRTLGDLVGRHFWLSDEDQERIWRLIEEWSETATDEEKSELREKIRTNALTRRSHKRSKRHNNPQVPNRARRVCDMLLPSDVVLRHKWLFARQWVDESVDELEDEEFDYSAHEERIDELRRSALAEIKEARGVEGILLMTEIGDAAETIGRLLVSVLEDEAELLLTISHIIRGSGFEESEKQKELVRGVLNQSLGENHQSLLRKLFENLTEPEIRRAYKCLPFSPSTWDLIEQSCEGICTDYWNSVTPRWMFKSRESNDRAINKLIVHGRPKAAFYMVHHRVEEISPRILVQLLKSIPSSLESVDEFQIDSYAIGQSFEFLNGCDEIDSSTMAELEFLYIELLRREEYPIPNLERLIASDAEFLVHVIVMAYKRSDDHEDPDAFEVEDPEIRKNRARGAHHLIENLSGLPFRELEGQDRETAVRDWVEKVKSGCKEFARLGVGESILGQLFAKSPVGEDGIWPGEIERNVLEIVITERMQDGVTIGLYNQRGVHFRDRGGNQERELAQKYEGWAAALEFTHPQTARVLRRMVETYLREAADQDAREEVNDRLRH